MASKNSLGQHLQFFYADLIYPTRITHVYNHSSSEITSFYYDFQVGRLANMKLPLHRMLNNVRRNYSILFRPVCVCVCVNCSQGHVFAMELSSGDEFYIACDNTGTPLAVFSNNGLLLKQVRVSSVVPERTH